MNNLNPLYYILEKDLSSLPALSQVGHHITNGGYGVKEAAPVVGLVGGGLALVARKPKLAAKIAAGGFTAEKGGMYSMIAGRQIRALSAILHGHGRSLRYFSRKVRDRDANKQARALEQKEIKDRIKQGVKKSGESIAKSKTSNPVDINITTAPVGINI